MGKKVEKAFLSKTPQGEEITEKGDEPYKCSGNFQVDFEELCKQSNLYYIPPVVARPRQIGTPEQNLLSVNRNSKKLSSVQAPPAFDDDQTSADDREVIEMFGFKPKTFIIKKSTELMKPCVQVELESQDKPDSVLEVFVRGWRIEHDIMCNFKLCFISMTKLHTLNFWRVGLTSERVKELSELLVSCEHIKILNIEANDVMEKENFDELILPESHLVKLRLRYCHITCVGAQRIANMLGNSKRSNVNLISLDLNGNKIGNKGAVQIAKALRTNRTLLHLSLGSNKIGDEGCKAIADSISQFVLTDAEILERRFIASEKTANDRAKSVSPTSSRRRDSKGSVRSGGEREKSKNRDKTAANPKAKKDNKDDKSKNAKKDDKTGPSKKASTTSEMAKMTAGNKAGSKQAPAGKTGNRTSKNVAPVDAPDAGTESMENMNPLLEKAEVIEPGKLRISGNFVLILLNLSRNSITEKGVDELVKAISFQDSRLARARVNGTGMMRILLKDNRFPEEHDSHKKLLDLLNPRDPFRKIQLPTPDPDD